MLKVNSTIIAMVKTNKTGNKCVNVDVTKDGHVYHVFRCLVTITLTQHSSTIYLQQAIIDYKKAHPEYEHAVNFKVINNLVQPNVITGNLAGMTVEFLNGITGQVEANTQSGVALTISSRLKITNNGWIRGGGGHGAHGGAGGNSSARSMMLPMELTKNDWIGITKVVTVPPANGTELTFSTLSDVTLGGFTGFRLPKNFRYKDNGSTITLLACGKSQLFSLASPTHTLCGYRFTFYLSIGLAHVKLVGAYKLTSLKLFSRIIAGYANNSTHGVGGVGGYGQYYGHPAATGVPTWTHKAGGRNVISVASEKYYGWRSGYGGRGGTGGAWGHAGGGGSAGAGAEGGHGNKGHPQLGNQGKSGDAVQGARFTKDTGSTFGNVNGHVIQ